MVDFSTPKKTESPYSAPEQHVDPDSGRFTATTANLMARINNGIVTAVFVIAAPTFVVGMILRLLDSVVPLESARQILLLVMGIGVAVWLVVMVKGIQLGRYLPGADFTGLREDD